MKNPTKTSPEKKLAELSLKKAKKYILIVVAIITYWQLYEYVSEVPNITVYLENSKNLNKEQITKISIKNGSESILKNDIIRPIKINFDQKLDSVDFPISLVNPNYDINNKSISLDFDLFNNDEDFIFYLYSNSRPNIQSVDFRIKNIESVEFYDYQKKSKFIHRVVIWIILLLIAILLFNDALIVISKDLGLGEIKRYIYGYPLTKKNRKVFIKGYEKVYENYKLRIKPPTEFMSEVVKNLFRVFPYSSEKEIYFIKRMTDFKTELYTLYRVRSAFVIISPLIGILSLIAILLNFFYYDLDKLNELISLSSINRVLITLLFLITIIIIIFPRSTMNLVLLKKNSKVKF